MTVVAFDPDARAEFLAAVGYYEECRSGLGHRLRLHVESAVQSIGEDPFRFRVLHPPFRRCLLQKFPYSVIFSIESEYILIVAVAHVKRKPGYWHERIERYRL